MRTITAATVAVAILLGVPVPAATNPIKVDIPPGLPPDLRALIERTFSYDPVDRENAVEKLGRMRERAAPAVPFLLRLVIDEDKTTREGASVSDAAVTSLGIIGTHAIEPYLAALKGATGEARSKIIYGIGRLHVRDPRIFQVLAAMLTDPVASVRSDAAEALKTYIETGSSEPVTYPSSIVPALAHALRDTDPSVQVAAIDIVGDSRDEQFLGRLSELLGSNDHVVRGHAVTALGKLGDRRATPALLKIMQNGKEEESVRCLAAAALGNLRDPTAVETLLNVLNDAGEPESLREDAVRGLGDCGDRRAEEPLQAVLENPSESPDLRYRVALTLETLEGARAVPLLTRVARTQWDRNDRRDPWCVQQVCALCVVRLTKGAIDDLALVKLVAGWADSRHMQTLDWQGTQYMRLIVVNGKTRAVRMAALRELVGRHCEWVVCEADRASANKEDQEPAIYALSAIYYPLSVVLWGVLFRNSLRQKRVTFLSILMLLALMGVGVLALPHLASLWR